MKKNSTLAATAAKMVLIALLFVSCEKEIVQPYTATTEITDGPGTRKIDISSLYQTVQGLPTDEWTAVPAAKTAMGLPFTHLRRSEMISKDFYASVTDGKTIAPGAKLPIGVYEGITDDGQKALFVISPDQLAGYYVQGEEYMVFQSQNVGNAKAAQDLVDFRLASEWQTMAPAGTCGLTAEAPEMQVTDIPAQKSEANCWKLEILVHGDYPYFIGPAGGVYNNAVFGLVSAVVLADPPYSAINMDLIIPNGSIVVTQSYTNFSTDVNELQLIVQNFWNQFPFTQRDMVLYVSGANLRSGTNYGVAGKAYDFRRICVNYSQSIALVEWLRNPNGSANTTLIGRLVAHEVGHLLDARHTDPACSGGIMYSILDHGCASSNFTQVSRDQMNWHLWFNNACLHQATCN